MRSLAFISTQLSVVIPRRHGVEGASQFHATSHAAANVLQKRKRNSEAVVENGINRNEVDTSKPTAVFEAKEGRAYTLSIALPGSIIAKLALLPDWQTQPIANILHQVPKRLNCKRS